MTQRIDIEPSTEAKCWLATFTNVPGMPDGVPLPLPFTTDATFECVANDLMNRFPRVPVALIPSFARPAPKDWRVADRPTDQHDYGATIGVGAMARPTNPHPDSLVGRKERDQPSPLQRHAERRLADDIDLELDVW